MLNRLNKTIGNNLIHLREERELDQYEAAEQIGIARQTLSKYENPEVQAGTPSPKLETLCRIAEFYGVSIDYLCGNIPGTTHDITFIMEYTGLSESAINKLHKLKHDADLDKRVEEREKAFLKENPDADSYVSNIDVNEALAEQRADRMLRLFDTMLNDDELLSLISAYVYGDIQNIAYYNSSRELKQDVLSGYLLAFDAIQSYRIKTTSLIRPHLADSIIDCLKKYAKDNDEGVQVRRIRPEIDKNIIDI